MSELKIKVLNSPIFDGVAQDLVLKTDNTNRIVVANTGPISLQSNVNLSNNLTFTGTGNRITGDFSNGTLANQVMLQTSTNNGNTTFYSIPNGTGTSTSVAATNSSDVSGTSTGAVTFLQANSTDGRFGVGRLSASGTFLPMTFYTGGNERVRVDASGNVGIGTSSPAVPLDIQTSTSHPTRVTVYGASPSFNSRRANGTPSSPTAVTANQTLFQVSGTGYGATEFSSDINRVGVWGVAAETWTDAAQGTFIQFNTTATGTTTRSEKMRIDSSGNLGLGVTPSAWGTANSVRAMELGAGSLWSFSTSAISVNQNAYFDGTNYVYKTSTQASRYTQIQGTHLWYSAASGTAGNAITFGDPKMTLDASGNLGIGTDLPSTKLQIKQTTDSSAGGISMLSVDGVSASVISELNDGSMTFRNTGAERMRITSAGNVGIGTTSPAFKLVVSNGGAAGLEFDATAVASGALIQAYNRSGAAYTQLTYDSLLHVFRTSGSERARIDSSGNFVIGATSTSQKFRVYDAVDRTEATAQFSINGAGYSMYQWLDGTACYIGQNSNSRDLRMYAGSTPTTGVRLTPGATAWASTSDERDKDIIEPIVDAANKLSGLRAIIGKYKTDDEGTRRSFLIAQDVKIVLPEAVSEDADGMLSLRYTDVIPLLTAAIQELTARLEVLENKQ